MTNRIRVRLGLTGTGDEATLEFKGSHEWIVEVWPYISYVVGGMVKAHGADSENMAVVYSELLAADEAARRGYGYEGLYVTTTVANGDDPS